MSPHFIRIFNNSGPKYTIALCAWDVINRILGLRTESDKGKSNAEKFLTVTSYIENNPSYELSDIAISVPTIIDENGIKEIKQVALDEKEARALRSSAASLKEELKSLKCCLEGRIQKNINLTDLL